ncbi:MAG: hypothetical protein AB7O49_14585 [Sphingomonadales bacterium]
MSLLEIKEIKRLGYGFGVRQAALLAVITGVPPKTEAAPLAARVRSILTDADGDEGAAPDATMLPREVAAWASSLQRRARLPVFDRVRQLTRRETGDGAVETTLLIPFIDLEAARSALAWAVGLANRFDDAGAGGDTAPVLESVGSTIDAEVEKLTPRVPTGVNSYRICEAAYQEKIPFSLFFRDVVILGEGVRLKRMLSTITDDVSAIGVSIARNKMQTAMALRQAGFPTVRHSAATSEDHAAELANKSGYPTVVKPADADGGAGVAAGLMTEAAVREAYRDAHKVSKNVIVEGFVEGNNYRVHVCNGRIMKTTLRRPGGVDGDGVSSIRELVTRHEEDPQARRRRLERGRFLLELDDEARQLLGETGMTEDSVPAAGQFVPLRRRSNVSTGGTTTDVRGSLHPDNEAMFKRAAALLGLDFAGIDFISPDISRSWLEVPSAICEINAQPQLGNDLNPQLYNELLREYLGGNGRIPWVYVLGDNAAAQEASALAERIRAAMHKRVAPAVLVSSGGVRIGKSRIAGDADSLSSGCTSVVLGRYAAAAVVVCDPTLVVSNGLSTPDLDFVVLPKSEGVREHLELSLQMLLPQVRKAVVVEVGDPTLAILRKSVPASLILLVSPRPMDAAVEAHLAAGGRAIWLDSLNDAGEGPVELGSGSKRIRLGTLKGSGLDEKKIRDLMIARLIEVQLPQPPKPAAPEKGA